MLSRPKRWLLPAPTHEKPTVRRSKRPERRDLSPVVSLTGQGMQQAGGEDQAGYRSDQPRHPLQPYRERRKRKRTPGGQQHGTREGSLSSGADIGPQSGTGQWRAAGKLVGENVPCRCCEACWCGLALDPIWPPMTPYGRPVSSPPTVRGLPGLGAEGGLDDTRDSSHWEAGWACTVSWGGGDRRGTEPGRQRARDWERGRERTGEPSSCCSQLMPLPSKPCH